MGIPQDTSGAKSGSGQQNNTRVNTIAWQNKHFSNINVYTLTDLRWSSIEKGEYFSTKWRVMIAWQFGARKLIVGIDKNR